MKREDFENNLSEALCNIDKIETLTKLLQQTLTEKSDFEEKDCLNISSILSCCVKNTKNILTNLEKSTLQKIL